MTMAEVMLSDQHRESLQSLDKLPNGGSDDNMSAVMMDGGNGETLKLPHLLPHHMQPQQQHHHNNTHKRVTHDTRTVVIEIPNEHNEAKRRKVSTSITTKQVIEGIGNAIREEDRRVAIGAATTTFDHNTTPMHDEELALGADSVLVKHLGFLLSQKVIYSDALSMTSLAHETSCTCEALEMVMRASPTRVSESFSKFGRGLLAMLIHIINEEVSVRLGRSNCRDSPSTTNGITPGATSSTVDPNSVHSSPPTTVVVESSPATSSRCDSPIVPPVFGDSEVGPAADATHNTREGDVTLRKATRILGHFARVGAATQPMAYFPGLLPCLVGLLSLPPGDTPLVPPEVCLNSLWILANLACNSENMVMMACQPNLVPALVSMASRQMPTPANEQPSPEVTIEVFRSQSIASRALVNLSWAPQNRIPLVENTSLLDAMAMLSVQRYSSYYSKSRTIQELIRSSRRHAVGTLRNLASAVGRRCKLQLCHHGSGLLLDRLTDAALKDSDGDVKSKAFGTILHLAHQDTAQLMVGRPALVLALKDALLSEEHAGDVNSDASKALRVLERSILPHMDSYSTLRELLEEVHPSSSSVATLVSGDEEATSSTSSLMMAATAQHQQQSTYNSNLYVDEEGNTITAEAL